MTQMLNKNRNGYPNILLLSLVILLLLSGCDSHVDDYLDGRVLKDKNGCAFTYQVGSSGKNSRGAHLKLNPDETNFETCKFIEPK